MAEEIPKQEAPQAVAPKKNKKINKMTQKEIDKKLDEVKEKMGSLSSKYALELLRRKSQLAGQ